MTTLVPSYGRDYKSQKEVRADWNADKDFTICNMFSADDGRQINRADAKKGEKFMIRFKGLRNICVVTA